MLAHRRQRRPKNELHPNEQIAAEQAIARGLDDKQIAAALGATEEQVADVRLWLDEVNASPDEVPQPWRSAAQRKAAAARASVNA